MTFAKAQRHQGTVPSAWRGRYLGRQQVMRMDWGLPQFIKGLVWLRCLHVSLGMRENKEIFRLGGVVSRCIFGMIGWWQGG